MPHDPQAAAPAPIRPQDPSTQDRTCASATPRPEGAGSGETSRQSGVGAGLPELNLRSRVERVQHDLEAGRSVSDGELRQHAADCTFLMESAYDRFMHTQDDEHRQEAYAWMARRDEALKRLSPAWKARRAAEIDAAIGSAHFMEDGERDRAALASNDAGRPQQQ